MRQMLVCMARGREKSEPLVRLVAGLSQADRDEGQLA
jgi:hypothetical protein